MIRSSTLPLALRRFLSLAALMCLLVPITGIVGCGDDKGKEESSDVMDTDDTDATTDTMEEVDTVEDMDADGADLPCPAGFNYCLDEAGRPSLALCDGDQICNRTSGCCEEPFFCESDQECEDSRDIHRDCPDDGLACVCNTQSGECFPFICSGDTDCDDGEICANGGCIPAPDESELVARIVTPPTTFIAGDEIRLDVVAVQADNPAVVVRSGVEFNFESSDEGVLTVTSMGRVTGVAEGTATVTASVANNGADPGDTVELNVIVSSEDPLRVYLVTSNDGQSVPDGTTVWMTDANDVSVSATTTAGSASFGPTVDFPVTVSVFEDAYGYVTLTDVAPVDPATRLDLFLPVGRNTVANIEQNSDMTDFVYDLTNVGAVTGSVDFDAVVNTGEIEVSLTGLSINDRLFELDLDLLIGPGINQYVGSPINSEAEVPSGVTISFGEDDLVANYVAVGEPPARTLWSVGGRVSLFENPNLLQQIIDQADSQDISAIVAAVLPFFRNFYSGVTLDVPLMNEQVSMLDNALAIPTDVETQIPINTLVETSDGAQSLALVLGGAVVPGQGLLPLGLTAAVAQEDSEGNFTGLYDGDPTTPDVADDIYLNMAPRHSGLEGPGSYAIVMAALDLDDGSGVRTTGVVSRLDAGSAVPAVAPMPRSDLPPLPETSSWDDGTRTITVGLGSGENPEVVRVILEATDGRRWIVYAPGDKTSLEIPDPMALAGAQDRADKDISISTLAFDGGMIDYNSLIDFQGTRLNQLVETVSEFTVYQIR